MSPRFYGFLWILFFASAGILWLAGGFWLTALIVYGFLMFGLVFTGMMCVLPGEVSHPPVKREKTPQKKSPAKASASQATVSPANVRYPIGFRFP